jgi:hypothetical protein
MHIYARYCFYISIAKVKQSSPRITASNVQGLEALVRDIVRGELAVSMGE